MNQKEITIQQARYIKRSNIIKGTLILTIAGFITRFIGFFYRVFLSNIMGAELLGIYQLIFPVYAMSLTIFAVGIQTSISRLVAAELGKRNTKNMYKILRIGIMLSASLAIIISIFVYFNADYIARRFLLEARSASSLKILAFAFPFCGITNCINGYYYGLKKAGVPASTQLLEQIVRVIVVYFIALYSGNGDIKITCELAVLGLVLGEVASCLYNFSSLFITKSPSKLLLVGPVTNTKPSGNKDILKSLLSLSIPLSANRLLVSMLHSIEAILIPTMLRRFGLSSQDSLVIFGILSGMSIPFIMFPTALTNALAILLLPTVSEAQAVNNHKLIEQTTSVASKYSIMIGIFSTGIFAIFGKDLGNTIFHNELAGSYLSILAWLCPFIYLATTLGSVINGLGKAHITFINTIIGSICKIILIIFLIPAGGIKGYLISLLIGQLIITALDSLAVIREVHFTMDAVNSILKPGIIVTFSGFLMKASYDYIKKMTHIQDVILLMIFCFLLCVISLILLVITKAVSRDDFR
jgi:stage V sporulation protein B